MYKRQISSLSLLLSVAVSVFEGDTVCELVSWLLVVSVFVTGFVACFSLPPSTEFFCAPNQITASTRTTIAGRITFFIVSSFSLFIL